MELIDKRSNGMIFIPKLRIVFFTVCTFLLSILSAQDFSNDSVFTKLQPDSLIDGNLNLATFISEGTRFANNSYLDKYNFKSEKETHSDIKRSQPSIFIGKGVVLYDPEGILQSDKIVIVPDKPEIVSKTKSKKSEEKVSKKNQKKSIDKKIDKPIKITSSPVSKSSLGISLDHFSFAVFSTTFIKFNKAVTVDSIDKSNIPFLWQIKTIFYSRYLLKSFYLEGDFFIRPPPFIV